jgi:hypothetical protein
MPQRPQLRQPRQPGSRNFAANTVNKNDQAPRQMSAFKSDFLNVLQERGFIHQCSDFEGLDALAAKGEAMSATIAPPPRSISAITSP